MATFCNCPFDGMYGHLPVCPSFTPTQSEASEPAEGDGSLHTYGPGVERVAEVSKYQPTNQSKPTADLVSEAREFWKNYRAKGYAHDENQLVDIATLLASFAQHKLQAQSPAAIIEDFVERVEKEMNRRKHQMPDNQFKDGYNNGLHHCWTILRSVAEDMKRK